MRRFMVPAMASGFGVAFCSSRGWQSTPETVTVMYLSTWKQQTGGALRDLESTFTSQVKVGRLRDTTEGGTDICRQLPPKCRTCRDRFGGFVPLSYSQKEGKRGRAIITQSCSHILYRKLDPGGWGAGSVFKSICRPLQSRTHMQAHHFSGTRPARGAQSCMQAEHSSE